MKRRAFFGGLFATGAAVAAAAFPSKPGDSTPQNPTTPHFINPPTARQAHRLGTLAFDGGGNAYRYIQFTSRTPAGRFVPCGSPVDPYVGVAMLDADSGEWGWVQVFGHCGGTLLNHPYVMADGQLVGVAVVRS
jgi:hypothetical protein